MLALLGVLLAATPAAASAEPHHEGFFLRMDLGVGWSSSFVSGTDVSGPGAGIGIGIGGNVADNLALFGQLVGTSAAKPKVGGRDAGIDSLSFGGLGIGLTYYLMPQNVFFSGVLGLGTLTERLSGFPDHNSNPGLIARLGFGKEWFVSRTWGLGIAGYLNLGLHGDEGSATWKSVAPVVAFSAMLY